MEVTFDIIHREDMAYDASHTCTHTRGLCHHTRAQAKEQRSKGAKEQRSRIAVA